MFYGFLTTTTANTDITQTIANVKAIAGGVIDTVADILEVCTSYPLNLFIGVALVGLGLGLVARLKRSIIR